MLNSDSITFGKYSGKSLDNVLKDRKYCRWLIKQEWFMNSYEYLYNRMKEYKPLSYFLKSIETDSDLFIHRYPYFNMNSLEDVKLNLTKDEEVCYKFYLSIVKSLRDKIIDREGEPNQYAIKAPSGWLKKFETETELSRDVFKSFLSSYELPNITSIVEDIKKEGGIEYKGAKSFLIAKENSEKQEKWWEGILKAEFGENVGTQFKYKDCIFDFINISTNTLYECKLGLKDFNEDQYRKYLIALENYRIVYLISDDCIIDMNEKVIQTTNPDKYSLYIATCKNPTNLDTIISGYKISKVNVLKLI